MALRKRPSLLVGPPRFCFARHEELDTISELPDHPLQAESEDGLVAQSPMLEIANAMVRLYKDAFGRGPTKARAQLAGPDILFVTLENSLTAAERNLVRLGEDGRLRETRLFFQHTLEHEFRSIVETTLGRRTVAFISGLDTKRDVAIEFFTLEPQSEVVQFKP